VAIKKLDDRQELRVKASAISEPLRLQWGNIWPAATFDVTRSLDCKRKCLRPVLAAGSARVCNFCTAGVAPEFSASPLQVRTIDGETAGWQASAQVQVLQQAAQIDKEWVVTQCNRFRPFGPEAARKKDLQKQQAIPTLPIAGRGFFDSNRKLLLRKELSRPIESRQ
jgi:hypothetical protein